MFLYFAQWHWLREFEGRAHVSAFFLLPSARGWNMSLQLSILVFKKMDE
jgi:hypothetical protein